jgi:ABC-type polysaccharide/polyol phosphate transport system ATPase subunit
VPVHTLGSINPRGWTRGTRTIAGSLIFTMFDKNIVYKLQEVILNKLKECIDGNKKLDLEILQKNQFVNYVLDNLKHQRIVMDMMPPFDITIVGKNEYGGKMCSEIISGVIVCDEGQVHSIEDIITENTMSFQASDLKPLCDE